jgi:Domain of unknown function (DUF4386)
MSTLMTAPVAQLATDSSRTTMGRTLGILMLLHLAGGLILPFVLIDRVRDAGFLASAAVMPNQLRAAVILLFVGSAFAVAIAIAAWPLARRYSVAMALWLLALSVAGFSLQAVDNAHLMSILSLSQEYAKAGAAKTDLFQALAIVSLSARKWAHYSYLLVAVTWMLLLFSLLYRFRLVPRALAGLGVVASLLQIASVTVLALFGYRPQVLLATPLGPIYAGLALWLIVKGFEEQREVYPEEITLRHLAC